MQFVKPPPIEHAAPGFRAHLADGDLRIELIDEYADVESATQAVAPFLDGASVQHSTRRSRSG